MKLYHSFYVLKSNNLIMLICIDWFWGQQVSSHREWVHLNLDIIHNFKYWENTWLKSRASSRTVRSLHLLHLIERQRFHTLRCDTMLPSSGKVWVLPSVVSAHESVSERLRLRRNISFSKSNLTSIAACPNLKKATIKVLLRQHSPLIGVVWFQSDATSLPLETRLWQEVRYVAVTLQRLYIFMVFWLNFEPMTTFQSGTHSPPHFMDKWWICS